MSRTANNVRIPLGEEKAVSLLLRVKPCDGMPRPAAHRQKSIMAEGNEGQVTPKAKERQPKK
jgi:hypothetical protein